MVASGHDGASCHDGFATSFAVAPAWWPPLASVGLVGLGLGVAAGRACLCFLWFCFDVNCHDFITIISQFPLEPRRGVVLDMRWRKKERTKSAAVQSDPKALSLAGWAWNLIEEFNSELRGATARAASIDCF